jgi:iron complex transport system ATP-binding protein
MAIMDIGHLASRAITDLSGGERQRTVIARALAQTPRVMLLDEPTAFLDLQHQIEICSVLRRLRDERGLTVVIVSHDLNLASQYCDRVVMLKEGRVCSVGTPSEVMSVERLREVYGCDVLIDPHPESGLPRITLPRRYAPFNM